MRTGSAVYPVAVACAGIATYAMMDAVMKGLSQALGVYVALFWRLALGVGLTGALYLGRQRERPAPGVVRIHAARSAIVTVMALAFFWGIARVPLAEAIGLSFIAPLIALALAAAFLGERIGRRNLAAAVLGLVGVGIVLAGRLGERHDADTGWGLAAVLLSAVFYAINLVMARHQAQRAGPREIAFYQNLFVLLFLALGAPWWLALPPGAAWPALVAAAGLAVISLLLLSWANARAEAQVLVNVEYTAFGWAALMGWLVFAEPVTAATMAGTALIVGACVLAARGGGPGTPDAEVAV